MSPCTEHPGLLCVIYCTFAMLRLASKDSNMLLAFCPSCLQNDLRLRLAISYDGFRNYPKSYTVSTRPPPPKTSWQSVGILHTVLCKLPDNLLSSHSLLGSRKLSLDLSSDLSRLGPHNKHETTNGRFSMF
jgi:hypothetical protein